MHDPQTLESLRDFGQKHLSALETLLSAIDSGTWGERFRGWLTSCTHSPHAALRQNVLETAVVDLVTLELACQAYVPEENVLRLTDRGGTVWARQVLAELLLLLSEWDPKMARALASLARSSRNERLGQIRSLIAART
ncbi:hypothetical protein [Phaeobacter sp. 22II1-1F12B]|uniref:hypothetical protein n=1 Tax=Phaeobacter sp. 22II1-1F12B TaxID=1317111 RepID=UPI000B526108|nr:hypothetical protein [Phaeobacter sp. 22II1-1F12B]OWU68127.1 hypothetical protein ATO1_25400 [Phaeobacter sp. 22II1-1F12B]